MLIEFVFVWKQQKITSAASKKEVALILFLLALGKKNKNKKNQTKTNNKIK